MIDVKTERRDIAWPRVVAAALSRGAAFREPEVLGNLHCHKRPISCGFGESDEFGFGDRHTLSLEEQAA